MIGQDFTTTWLETLSKVLHWGASVAPRGRLTLEIPQHTIEVDMRKPVILSAVGRKLSYRFMAAEAFWILSGDNRVETIAPYNKNISAFSDDGETFFGAYGPRIHAQLPYVIQKLSSDRDTRQAGLTIWRENPPQTKDVPCTVSIFFNIRGDRLNVHVFMRSSDVWLGVPYDVFNFSMLGHLVCAILNNRSTVPDVKPGELFLTAASSHLYDENTKDATDILHNRILNNHDNFPLQPDTPVQLHRSPELLMGVLKELRDSKSGDAVRWWEK